VLTAVAHNLVRWVASLGLGLPTPLVIKTQRRRLITLLGRWTTSARRSRLSLPEDWPWEKEFMAALSRLRSLPFAA
jgi:hypothetical protein